MTPQLHPGELVLVTGARRRLRRGEIVAARPAALGGQALAKRVTALPHDTVHEDAQAWQLGPDEYFLSGDNPLESLDSRHLGPVPKSAVIGSVRYRLWPPTRWGRLT